MGKRIGLWLTAAVLAVIVAPLIVFYSYYGSSFPVEITTEEAQARINVALEKHAGNEKRVQVENVVVRFEDNQIYIDARASGIVKKRRVQADVHAIGTVRYDGGSFYFKPTEKPRFENVRVEKLESKPGLFAKTREKLFEKGREFAAKHELEPLVDAFKADFKDWVIAIAESGVVFALTHKPIYTLKSDIKGMTVKAVLEKVEVVGDKLMITISLAQLAYTIFLAIVVIAIVIAIVIFLILNPEFGMVLAEVATLGSVIGR